MSAAINRCQGITTKGNRCKIMVRGGDLCRYHNKPHPIHPAPLKETVIQDSPVIQRHAREEIVVTNLDSFEQKPGTRGTVGDFIDPINETHQLVTTPSQEKGICCVCLDEDVEGDDLLKCQHSLCTSCLNRLNRDECPVCRRALEGRQVTSKVREGIRSRQRINKDNEETANYLVALALEDDPDADPVALYDRFYRAI